ncbi:hypothetical protein QUF72_13965 [Desulfobacterales bacterium HSG2]|nr:hypothetical protein [Desulfobacterales bacterium HSG2]
MEDFIYAFEERIGGEPSLFCGRKQELELLLRWTTELIPKKLAKSRALLGRRKSGKTAIMQRLFNILWNLNGNVVPFYIEVLDQDQWLLEFSDEYFRTFLSQYISFKTRTPLRKKNKPWKWNDLNEMVRSLDNKEILREAENFQDDLEKEDAHNAMRAAFAAPAEFTGYDDISVVVMIDEIQHMTKHIFYDKERKNRAHNLPGAFHGLVELKYAPMLVSGSYIGWMTRMMREMFVGGRLKRTRVSPKLTFPEAMEAIRRYAEHHGIPITEENSLVINHLTQSDPFYIDILFRSDWAERDFSTTDGVIRTFEHEILDPEGELFGTWSEYIDISIDAVNDIHGKKMLLYLSKERHKECSRDDIREHIGWPPEQDRELERKLKTLAHGDLITLTTSNFHYRGIPDDVLDIIFRELYQYEIDHDRPNVRAELAQKIETLRKEKKSVEGMLSELKGRMLELFVWRELNKCRKENRTVTNFAGRLRKVTEAGDADKMNEVIGLCAKSKFANVRMNHYIQLTNTPALEVDVLAEGEDEDSRWFLVFEAKNRDERNPVTTDQARRFATKVDMIRKLSEQKKKKTRFVCPVYLSAKGFRKDVEEWLHSQGILTADMETWDV